MLRLWKKGSEVHVSMRMKKKNRAFLRAFLIACFLHLFALVVFRVHSYFFQDEQTLPPTIVEADASFGSEEAIAVVNEGTHYKRYLFEPLDSFPVLPDLPATILVRKLEEAKTDNLVHNPFTEIEKSYDQILSKKQVTEPFFFQINVSGKLAEVPLLIKNEEEMKRAYLKMKDAPSECCLSYQVQVEGKTGTIFWYLLEQQEISSELKMLAEALICQMRFKQDQKAFVHIGRIEIEMRKS